MGLAVAQVRLLALTNRKADIELRMQVNSKRKMMLTRKATELAQQYYSKLKCANIQYATSTGYEDVDYNYLMGNTEAGLYKPDFIQGIATASSKVIKKSQNNMILVNQVGEVIVNDTMAKIVAAAKDDTPMVLTPSGNAYSGANKTGIRTANAILMIVEEYKDKPVLDSDTPMAGASSATDLIFQFYKNADGSINETKRSQLLYYMQLMMKNEGYKDGGVIYTNGTGGYFCSSSEAGTPGASSSVIPSKGYMYEIRNADESTNMLEAMWTGSGFDNTISKYQAKYLGNLISYFGPIISAALQNGTSTDIEVSPKAGNSDATKSDNSNAYVSGDDLNTTVKSKIESQVGTLTDGAVYLLRDNYGNPYYFKATNTNPGGTPVYKITKAKSTDYNEYNIKEVSGVVQNQDFVVNQNTEKLQDNFRSGVAQLAMVTDVSRGIYHKNTTMNYFTHMNYVVERTDTSRREEITAWFNTEQAAISEQETYWDTEIQNLSTELSSVNTEISSVKQLKSDNIKSVFNWGGN